jgi:ATP-dependent Clp protease ATP-binding subunit ClpA
LHRAVGCASERDHEYTTLEHLLLALIDDADASAVMDLCKVDLGRLKEDLVSYIDGELKALVITDGRNSRPTPGFQRVVERAALSAQVQGRDPTGADILVAIFGTRCCRRAGGRALRQPGSNRPCASRLKGLVP